MLYISYRSNDFSLFLYFLFRLYYCFFYLILRIRKFEIEDAKCLYENHLEEEVKRWIPNESYVDIEETQGAIKFYIECVNGKYFKSSCYKLCHSF